MTGHNTHPAEENAGSFFHVDDWEHNLDTLANPTREQLQQILDKAPTEHPTARFLKSILMQDSCFTFTPFADNGELAIEAGGQSNA